MTATKRVMATKPLGGDGSKVWPPPGLREGRTVRCSNQDGCFQGREEEVGQGWRVGGGGGGGGREDNGEGGRGGGQWGRGGVGSREDNGEGGVEMCVCRERRP